ncbi:MAG TPA: nitroreductase family protein [Cytophagaceae bacterium]|jgi:nitroreductase|nr:nitroreductase family protein [Cytophagaceae bacterium]
MHSVKKATTHHPVIDLIKNRWSPRSFFQEEIEQEDLDTLLEAASWAASANNEQPWQYIYAHRGTEGYETIKSCLAPFNASWAKDAGVLMATIVQKNYTATQKDNRTAMHDVGMANANLLLQAVSMNIYGHPMGGFDLEKLHAVLNLKEDQDIACVIALGYLDIPDKLEEILRIRETQSRQRKALAEFTKRLE